MIEWLKKKLGITAAVFLLLFIAFFTCSRAGCVPWPWTIALLWVDPFGLAAEFLYGVSLLGRLGVGIVFVVIGAEYVRDKIRDLLP